MSKPLHGRVAVVTGSGQGVGRGVALVLASAGAKVVTNDIAPRAERGAAPSFRSTALAGKTAEFEAAEADEYGALIGDADTTAAEIIAGGGEAVACYADVADSAACERLVRTAVDEFGSLDIVVNNAAGLGFGPFASLAEEDWRHQVDVKLNGTFHMMRHAVPVMAEQGYGRIINTVSDALVGIAAMAPYSASNAAVVALTKSTAKELLRLGITVNAFAPQAKSPGHVGFTATLRAMLASHGMVVSDEERMAESERAHGPAENLTFLSYLASEEAAAISGAVFSVTAGGRIALWSEPQHVAAITKDGAPWTFEELRAAVPERLLAGYVSVATQNEF